MGAAIARSLLQIGAGSKEREVTAALSALLEAEAGAPAAPEREAVPQAVGEQTAPGSDAVLSLSEVEMFEASGPIRRSDAPGYMPDAKTERIDLPVPPEAFPPKPPAAAAPPTAGTNLIDAVRNAAALGSELNPLERAVQLFDLGMALRAQHRYLEALDAWEQALALAPDNLVYQANAKRLRAQLGNALG